MDRFPPEPALIPLMFKAIQCFLLHLCKCSGMIRKITNCSHIPNIDPRGSQESCLYNLGLLLLLTSLFGIAVFMYFWSHYPLLFGLISLLPQYAELVFKQLHDCYTCYIKWLSLLHTINSRYRGKAPVTWRTTWRSRWTTLTPSPCRSRASHQQNAGRTCTNCSISTPSSLIPLGFWRKAPQRTACQVGVSFQQPAS